MRLSKIGIFALLFVAALALVACGDTAADEADVELASSGDPVAGEELFNQGCIACHGPEGEGIEGLGKPFPSSDFIRTHSDEELLEFIKQGRPISDPENTTGVDMPPKGGNPALTDEQIMDIVAYIRTLQE